MNTITISNNQGIVLLTENIIRVTVNGNHLSVMLDGGYNQNAKSIPKGKMCKITITGTQEVEQDGQTVSMQENMLTDCLCMLLNYNFAAGPSSYGGDALAVYDNTIVLEMID